ncbi:MAG: hypothetical protein KDD69_04555 [Bdellovibrionales bacterium]|nr:hypothetical protein [Bdellovibrionales bacterium]
MTTPLVSAPHGSVQLQAIAFPPRRADLNALRIPLPNLSSNLKVSCAPIAPTTENSTNPFVRRGKLLREEQAGPKTQQPRHLAKNYDPALSPMTVYVNGITAGNPLHGPVADRFGVPTTLVVNDQDRSVVIDVGNAVAGILDKRWGRAAEPEAVENLFRLLRRQLDPRTPASRGSIHLIGYSQGGVVISNALGLFREEIGEQAWGRIAPRIRVTALGSAMHEWPRGVEVIEYAHRGDSVAKYSSWLAKIKSKTAASFVAISRGYASATERLAAWREGRQYQPLKAVVPELVPASRRVVLDYDASDAHDLHTYLRHLPDFFLARHRDATGRLDPVAAARDLATSIAEARFSDDVHSEIRGRLERKATSKQLH